MIVYVGLAVGIHGLNARTAGDVAGRVRAALVAEFNPDHDGDIEVEVDEFAGTEEPPSAGQAGGEG